jgi:hypothetical protein
MADAPAAKLFTSSAKAKPDAVIRAISIRRPRVLIHPGALVRKRCRDHTHRRLLAIGAAIELRGLRRSVRPIARLVLSAEEQAYLLAKPAAPSRGGATSVRRSSPAATSP